MKIAKLILHYNTPEITRRLCRMVPDAIFIDNGSEDGLFQSDLSNPVMRFTSNLGFTLNWNRAIKMIMAEDHGTTDAFWLMNSDIEISQESINRIEYLMELHPYAMVTPSYNCWMKACKNNGSPGIRQVGCIEFTAPVIRRSVFDQIGFFDETFSLGYGVEFDWALRMQDKGLKQYCDDGSVFYHHGQQTITAHGSLNEYEAKAVYELNRGMEKFYGNDWREMIKLKLGVTFGHQPKKRIAVYTTIFSQYNYLLPVPAQSEKADFFCICDTIPEHGTATGSPGEGEQWKIIKTDFPTKDLPARLRAKFFKLFPWQIKEIDDYDIAIFIDGSIEITSPDFIRFCRESLGDSTMALYKHPDRDCVFEEAATSTPLAKYRDQNIFGQMAEYRMHLPINGGLYACGVMVRRIHSVQIREMMGAWWLEIIKWTTQDQLSFPLICKMFKYRPYTFPGNQYKNAFFRVHWHDDDVKQRKPKTK
jgi:GT2 family glycosyltransferase